MIRQPWWQQNPRWLEDELNALDRAGIRYERVEEAFSRGIAQLRLWVKVENEELRLDVVFPDLYPYFRFEIAAPTLALPHHQHPFSKNLCFLGRATENWLPGYTVAALIEERLRQVLDAGRAGDATGVSNIEQHQAEPYSDYYLYPPKTMVVIPRECTIDPSYRSGNFVMRDSGQAGPPPERLLRGLLTEIRGGHDMHLLARASERLAGCYTGQRLEGRWVRIDSALPTSDPRVFLRDVVRLNADAAADVPLNRLNKGWLQIWGILFPEEVDYRADGEGWVFFCLFDAKHDRLVRKNRLPSDLG